MRDNQDAETELEPVNNFLKEGGELHPVCYEIDGFDPVSDEPIRRH
jgi:hypothetical protein